MVPARIKPGAKLSVKFTKSRQIISSIAERAFGSGPIKPADTWFSFHVSGTAVKVFKHLKPFHELRDVRCNSKRCLRQIRDSNMWHMLEETIAYTWNLIKSRHKVLPLRIDIFKDLSGSRCAHELYWRVKKLVEPAKLEMDVEVHLDGNLSPWVTNWEFILLQRRLYSLNTLGDKEHALDVDQILRQIKRCMGQPNTALWPFTFYLEFDVNSKGLAEELKQRFKQAAWEQNVYHLVEYKSGQIEDNHVATFENTT